jgi:hypothetical protein
MKKLPRLLACFAAILVTCSGALTQDAQSVPRTAEIARPSEQVFAALKEYFSNSVAHQFELVSANQTSGTIVAKRRRIDENTWTGWAFCKTSALNMLDTLTDGTVTVNVKVQPDGPNQTRVTVAPDFKGYYSLGNAQHIVSCQSKGALEKDILTSAGPTASGPL